MIYVWIGIVGAGNKVNSLKFCFWCQVLVIMKYGSWMKIKIIKKYEYL